MTGQVPPQFEAAQFGFIRSWLPIIIGVAGSVIAITNVYTNIQVRFALIENQYKALEASSAEVKIKLDRIEDLIKSNTDAIDEQRSN